jgi:hypothetical protein
MVTEYLERPSPKNPQGRWVVIANDRVVCKPRPYPCTDGDGTTLDEPVLHKLAFIRTRTARTGTWAWSGI